MESTEEWRPVVGYEGSYEVSSLGSVRSLDRKIPRRDGTSQVSRGAIMTGSTGGPMGYLYVNLRHNGTRRVRAVHRLVAESFIGPLPEGMDTRHLNGNHLDNRASNLAYGTRADNMQDSIRHGKNARLKRTHCKHGHEYTLVNTRFSEGRRSCLTCERERSVRRRNAA